jgi:iron complex transport system substrate-binding protein
MNPLPFLSLAILLILAGCGGGEMNTAGALSFEDDLGREVRLAGEPTRLLPLAPNMTEIVFAAGAGDRVVAVTTADDHPPAIEGLPRIQPLPVDFEAIVRRDPHLILASAEANSPRDAATFEALGIPVAFFSFESMEDVARVMRQVGRMAGSPAAADSAAAAYEERIEQVRRATAHLPKVSVLFLVGDRVLYAFGSGSYVTNMVEAAGGVSVTRELGHAAPVLSEEFVLRAQPEVIVGAFGAEYDVSALIRLYPSWDVVPAVRDGRIYSVDASLFLRPGPRLAEGVERLALLLHQDFNTPQRRFEEEIKP